MTDKQFSLLCGEILRGVTILTACECAGITPAELLDYVDGDAARLNDLFAAAIMRAHTTRVPIAK